MPGSTGRKNNHVLKGVCRGTQSSLIIITLKMTPKHWVCKNFEGRQLRNKLTKVSKLAAVCAR